MSWGSLCIIFSLPLSCLANFYIDEVCCAMHLEDDPSCLDHCREVIADENITDFKPTLFSCAPRQVQQRLVKCVTRSNYGLPVGVPICCDRAVSQQCGSACQTSHPLSDFNGKCNRTTEVALYSCISEYVYLKECCYSTRVNLTCAEACNRALSFTPSIGDWANLRQQCDTPFPEVKQCLTRYTGESNRSKHECCNKSEKEGCRYVCNKGMSGSYGQADLLSALMDSCGNPVQDATWLCLMSEDSKEISPLGELTSVHCCGQGETVTCRNLCLNLYRNWLSSDLWSQFTQKCRYKPSEERMTSCILDVSEPCTLGCDHLDFCSNLNNRPLDLFRTCTKKHDEGAKTDYKSWLQTGFIQTPLVNLTVQNISTCRPNTWKGIACVLQTQPCNSKSHSNSICNSVCVDLLETCLDTTRSQHSVGEICRILAPNSDPETCVDLQHYLVPGLDHSDGIITHPCQPSPCRQSQQCVLNRNCATGDMYCTPYLCLDSCSVGALRDYQIEVGTWIRIPKVENSDCYKVCTCDETRKLSGCQNLPCPGSFPCKLGDTEYAHQSQFTLDCRLCVCYSGVVTCTMSGKCAGKLPGECAPFYNPVCATNGASYINSCVASQFGLETQLHYKLCSAVDTCANAKCPTGQVCRPKRQSCINLKHSSPCPQYECESPTTNCEGEDLEPVCDTQNVQHPHMCSLIQQNRELAHSGYCVGSCNSTSGTVCGANGISYSSTCSAESKMIYVDYLGDCRPPTNALLSQGVFCGDGVICQKLPANCPGVTVPGMCCPVCGAVLSLLPSQVLVSINEMYLTRDKITVSSLCRRLNKLLSLSECVVLCTPGLYGGVTGIVHSTLSKPTWVQIQACNNEAIRIETMVRRRHVRIETDLILSTILGVEIETVNVTLGNSSPLRVGGCCFCGIQIFILLLSLLLC